MPQGPLGQNDLERLLQALPRILRAGTLQTSITEALNLLRTRTGALAAVLFLADGDAPLREYWSPEDAAVKRSHRPRLKVEALEAIRRGGAHLTPSDGPTNDAASTRFPAGIGSSRTVLLASDQGPLGAATLAWSSSTIPDDPATRSWIAAVIELVYANVLFANEVGKLTIQAERDKRWFKTLDDHLRVLDRERQKFAAFVNQTDTFVFVTDEERVIRWNNRAMAVLLPFEDESSSWIGRSCREVCERLRHGPGGAEECECPIRAALENNEVTHQEIRLSLRGAPGVLYLTSLPIKGPDGKPREAMVLIQDLTGLETLRQSEARTSELRENEARHVAMVDAALDAIISIDHAGRILEFNPAAERIFHWKRADVLGRDMAELIVPPELRERHRKGMERYLASGEGVFLGKRVEITAMRADGSTFPVEITIARISTTGSPVFTSFIRDLTERRTAMEALRSAEDRLHTVLSESPLIVFALDRNGIYTVSAGKGLARLGRKEGEAVGKSVYEIYRDYPHVLANLDRCFAGEEFSAIVDIDELQFEAHYTPVRGADGEVVGLFGVATDLTERKSLEAQLRHAQKMEAVGRLAGGVAHDFNNLLTVIMGHSEVLLGKMAAADPARRSIEEIQKAGSRGVLLTRQLLAFSRRDVPTPEVLDVGEVVRGMESMLERLIGADIRLLVRTGSWPLCARADRGQLEQVLANLAVNARDAMPKGGDLVIEVSAKEADAGPGSNVPPGPYVALTISDQGCGMDPDVLGHLFEPFFTTKEQGKGTGLGLSVVYGIVRQCGGDIEVESAVGHGSTFRILLPRIGEHEASAARVPLLPSAVAVPPPGDLVLLVEDETAVRDLAREMLHALGYGVVEAHSGDEGLLVFERHGDSIRLVVTDIVMPGMSGTELARRLLARKRDLKVLLVSGYAKETLGGDDLTREGFAFLQKPYTMEDFGRKLAELLAGSVAGGRGTVAGGDRPTS